MTNGTKMPDWVLLVALFLVINYHKSCAKVP